MSFFSITFVEHEHGYGKELNRKILFFKDRKEAYMVDKFITDDYADFLDEEWKYLESYNYLKGEYKSLGVVPEFFEKTID